MSRRPSLGGRTSGETAAQVGSRTPVWTRARTSTPSTIAVDDERREAAPVQVAQQPGDDGQADAEGDDRRQDRRPPGDALARRRPRSAPRRPGRTPTRGRRGRPAGTSSGPRPTASSPRNSPAVIVPPERETPGISAMAWANPKPMPCGTVRSFSSRLLGADPVGPEQDQREDDQRGGDDPQVAQRRLDVVLEQQAEDDDRDAADDDQPAHARVRVALPLRRPASRARRRRSARCRAGSTGGRRPRCRSG